jgi:hypothetical protein
MKNLKEEPFKFRPNTKQFIGMIRIVFRYRKHPEELGPYLESLRAQTGAPITNMHNVRDSLLMLREAYLDNNAGYSLDQRLIVGIAALDLVLLAILVPLGVSDRALFLAFLALVISLVLVATSFIVSIVKHDLGITSYGKVHGNVVFFALATGTASLTATLWHVHPAIGLMFLVLAILAYFVCLLYILAARTAMHFIRLLEERAESESAPEPTEPSE